jgi:hypothetical protein
MEYVVAIPDTDERQRRAVAVRLTIELRKAYGSRRVKSGQAAEECADVHAGLEQGASEFPVGDPDETREVASDVG